jgi:hypothetical protein
MGDNNWLQDVSDVLITSYVALYGDIRQFEAALHREWQQLSQQDIRRPTGVMRRRLEAVIQARGVTPGTELLAIEVVK